VKSGSRRVGREKVERKKVEERKVGREEWGDKVGVIVQLQHIY